PSLDSLLMRYDTVGGGNQMKLWFTTNHDENSWNGTEYEKYGDLAKALAVFSFTWDGIPLIYSGQELPNMKRLEFFEKDVIAWNGNYAMADFYKTLTGLKTNNPALSAGDKNVRTYKMGTDHEKNALVYLRQNGAHEVFVMLNFTKENIDVKLNEDLLKGNYKNVFGGSSMDLSGKTSFHLDPWSYQVFEK
ncbi:MAG: 1,4-alpha-glucan branching protein, partial [Pedobacter sp.]